MDVGFGAHVFSCAEGGDTGEMSDRRLDEVRTAIEPVLAGLGLRCYDVERTGTDRGARLRVLVERAQRGGEGVDLDLITDATRALDVVLDDLEPSRSSYELEVSSPGLERPLRTPEHFAGALGSEVTVKTFSSVDGERRHRGDLVASDGEGCTLRIGDLDRKLPYEAIASARTVFEWGAGSESERTRKEATRS